MSTPKRWPGSDGWILLCLASFSLLLQWVRDLPGLGIGVGLAAVGTALYLAVTHTRRRPAPPPHPRPDVLRTLVVIPTHNNAGTIADVVRGCLERHPHVLVVDDGSTDESGSLAREAGALVLAHPTNRGKGAALSTALEHAAALGFSHIVSIDADGQHLPADLPRFLEDVRAHPDAILAGVRDMSDAPDGARYARANSNFWVWVETGRWIGDTQCGYRAYPVFSVRNLRLFPSRYEWEVEVLTRSLWAGIPVRDLPCRVYYPPREERVSSYRKVVDTTRISLLNVRLILERLLWPPRWLRPTAHRSWRDEHRGKLWGWRFFLGLLRLFGRRSAHIAVVPLALFYWALAGAQRRGVEAYLARRFPDASPWRRTTMALRVFVHFAWSLIDRFELLLRGPRAIHVRVDTLDPAEREEIYGGGLIVLSAHVGNPDLASMALQGKRHRPVNVLARSSDDDPYVALLRRFLGDRAPRFIPLEQGSSHAAIEVDRALRRGEVVVMKGDRVTDERTTTVSFLGSRVELPTGPLLLAALTGAPVVVVGCFRVRGGGYALRTSPPKRYRFEDRTTHGRDLRRWVQDFATQLEAWSDEFPFQWYNFYDLWDGEDQESGIEIAAT